MSIFKYHKVRVSKTELIIFFSLFSYFLNQLLLWLKAMSSPIDYSRDFRGICHYSFPSSAIQPCRVPSWCSIGTSLVPIQVFVFTLSGHCQFLLQYIHQVTLWEPILASLGPNLDSSDYKESTALSGIPGSFQPSPYPSFHLYFLLVPTPHTLKLSPSSDFALF